MKKHFLCLVWLNRATLQLGHLFSLSQYQVNAGNWVSRHLSGSNTRQPASSHKMYPYLLPVTLADLLKNAHPMQS